MKVLFVTGFLMSLLLSSQAVEASLHPWRDEDVKPGYTDQAKPESEETGEILYAIDDPYKNEIKLSEKIFDPALKKDVTTRYQEKFGRTEAEIIQSRTPYLNSNFSEGASITFNEEEYQKKQQAFGNYVAKRVVEFHFEKEAKENPDLRGVYEAKQIMENASATVGAVKLRAKYRISSNSVIAYIKNPFINIEARYEMSGDRETVYSLSRNFRNGYSMLTDYYSDNTRWDVIGRKALNPGLSVSLTYSPIRKEWLAVGTRKELVEYSLAIAGLSYVF